MTRRIFQIYVPLEEFDWEGDDWEFSTGIRIKRYAERPNLHGWDSKLSEDEKDRLFWATHWLTFPWEEGSKPSPASHSNLVLISLWLVKPTKTHAAFRFKLGDKPEADGTGRARLLDRFHWIPGVSTDPFHYADIHSSSKFYVALRDIHLTGGRLNNALLLTLSGCWAHQWQVALVCYAAAAETLLTYAAGQGITRRLATAYACLVESQPHERDLAFQEFRTLYSIRSDIMHGRTHNVSASDRLPYLARLAEVMRRLWSAVITTPSVVTVLEGTDAQRQAYFDSIQSGYRPPP